MPIQDNIFIDLSIPRDAITVKESAILDWLGYPIDSPDPYILEIIQNYIRSTHSLLTPKGGFIIKKLHTNSGTELEIENSQFHTGKIIAGQLRHAESIALFVATIGKEIENLANELFNRNEMLEGYIVNLIGSEAAEACAEYVHRYIAGETAKNGSKITNRFSPGYCNWDVSQQFLLFSQFPETFNAVSLTDSALMNPVKSVSGIIGIGSKVRFLDYKCALCTDDKCIYRKRKLS